MKYAERIAWLYYEFGLNNPFDINQAIDCMVKHNDTKNKSTLRSSIDIAYRDNLISIDSSAYPDFKIKPFVQREDLKWHKKMKTFYMFSENNFLNIINRLKIKPLDKDISPKIVKLFLEK